ncbi:hypothetical protein ABPG72_000209 [Tetrahymena utriculariae]
MEIEIQEEFDFFVIGGGSGGLAASKEAALFGVKVGLADFVDPTPIGTKWGLGGTCVNVGCIPKKLMHYAATYGESMEMQRISGWKNVNEEQKTHEWQKLVERIQNNVKKTNFGYKVALRENKVKYFNYYASLVDKNTIKLENKTGVIYVKAKHILISVGGRPNYLPLIDSKLIITSDDLFSLQTPPGKTLIAGGSYIALECAGFLNGLGYDVTVLYRSVLLRGFDQDVAERMQTYMAHHGVKFVQGEIKDVKQLENRTKQVVYTNGNSDVFDTVLLAIGRIPNTKKLGLENVGIPVTKSGKIQSDDLDRTNVDNIFAIGDAVDGRMELTPLAIKAGRYLARRLYNNEKVSLDYKIVPTTVFTPIEYSAIGLTEEEAIKTYGSENIWSYVSKFKPLEWVLSDKDNDSRGYCKLIVHNKQNERVLGLHYLGPHAAEVAQGFAVAMQLGATKADFDKTVAIHPSSAEELVLLKQIKGISETDEWLCCG